ncbi:hypothetical protein LIA77_03049 [Sarocladium implicatum]|nr:hypothetical protein LIA77_03049 [Sarocladium implicatum]
MKELLALLRGVCADYSLQTGAKRIHGWIVCHGFDADSTAAGSDNSVICLELQCASASWMLSSSLSSDDLASQVWPARGVARPDRRIKLTRKRRCRCQIASIFLVVVWYPHPGPWDRHLLRYRSCGSFRWRLPVRSPVFCSCHCWQCCYGCNCGGL